VKYLAILALAAISTSAAAQDNRSEANSPEARQAIESYGRCVAKLEPDEANRLLTMDFNSPRYRTGLRLLANEAVKKCAREVGSNRWVMRSAGLLFSGAMAEALLEVDTTPLNARLVRTTGATMKSYSATDAVAQCLARSLPDQVVTLFATAPGSDPEAAAAAPFSQAVPACARAAGIAAKVELTVPALRAMVATAAYRTINASAGGDDA
jgi:hypothetical protein